MTASVGTVTNSQNAKRSICLMVGLTAANPAPAADTDGVPNYSLNLPGVDTGACFPALAARESILSLFSTAGSGTLSGTFVLWGFLAAGTAGADGPHGGAGAWVQIETISGAALSGAAPLSYSERLLNLGAYDRLYLQCTAITGTGAAFEAWLTTARKGGQ